MARKSFYDVASRFTSSHFASSAIALHTNNSLSRKQQHKRRDFISLRESGESVREWVERNLVESPAGYILDVITAVLGAAVVAVYVYTNWVTVDKRIIITGWTRDVDFYTNIVFTIDYILRVYAARDRLDHILSFFRVMDFIVIVPSWSDTIAYWSLKKTDPINKYLRGARVLRALRILRAYRFLEFTSSTVQRQVLATLLTVLSIIISTAGILQFLESCEDNCIRDILGDCVECQDLGYLDFIYFVVVSIATLGYGDITPKSYLGKLLISSIILLTFILVPMQINNIVSVVSSHTEYSTAFHEAKQHPHIVLTGYIDVSELTIFFSEFFHFNNVNWNEKVVILNSRPPTNLMKKILNDYESKVLYIVGSPMLDEDLDRADLEKAKACYVLVNRNASDTHYADKCTALLTIALRRGNPTCPIYVEVLNNENAANLLKMGATDVISISSLKCALMGRSCEVKGLPTFFLNLLTNSSHEVKSDDVSFTSWQSAYIHGFAHGIYLVDIPRSFSGLTFGELIRFLYEKKAHVIPLAMLTQDGPAFVDHEFKLGATADPQLCCKVFAIARDLASVERVMTFPPEHIIDFRKFARKKAATGSSMDLRDDRKRVVPALGNELALVHEALVANYTNTTQDPEGRLIIKNAAANSELDPDYDDVVVNTVPASLSRHIVVCGFPNDVDSFLQALRSTTALPVPERGSPRNSINNSKQQHRADMADDDEASPQACGDESPQERKRHRDSTNHGSESMTPVVFLSSTNLTDGEYELIRRYPEVYFVFGSAVNFEDLRRTRIQAAKTVLILRLAPKTAYADENMVDADAITTLRYIVEITHHAQQLNLIVELDKATNITLLGSLTNDRVKVFLTRSWNPSIALRSRSTSTMFHTKRGGQLSLEDYTMQKQAVIPEMEEFVVSGSVFVNSMIEPLLSECYRKPYITPFLSLLASGNPSDSHAHRIFQVLVPRVLISMQYREVFRRILDKISGVLVGIYRFTQDGHAHACVLTNPPEDLVLRESDLLYIVGKPVTHEEMTHHFPFVI